MPAESLTKLPAPKPSVDEIASSELPSAAAATSPARAPPPPLRLSALSGTRRSRGAAAEAPSPGCESARGVALLALALCAMPAHAALGHVALHGPISWPRRQVEVEAHQPQPSTARQVAEEPKAVHGDGCSSGVEGW